MPTDCVSYQNSGYFSKLIVDYLDVKPNLKSFYNRFPNLENFNTQIEEKALNFPDDNRKILVSELEKQNETISISKQTLNNIHLLKNNKTYTITTGHQLNLFTGPLYFIYKIASTIKLCKELKTVYPAFNFVPVYWMATEDHDFDEINFFNFKDKKLQWNRESKGAVGKLSTEGLNKVYQDFEAIVGKGETAEFLINLFKKAYLEHDNLTNATRFLANELFKEEGLVIIDGDSSELKKLFIPYIKKELLEQISFKNVSETNALLKEYTIQVNPREINLFYLQNNSRERIIFEKSQFKVNNTNIVFSKIELLTELENFPERFSPNVILRPLYQEVILPNLCYIGGGGEIAYWLQLKSNFEANKITFPILLLRNSLLLVNQKQHSKIDNLKLSWSDLFLPQQELINKKTKEFSQFTIDFTEQKEHLNKQFASLLKIAELTDKSFISAVKAQEKKQIKGLENLEKRLLKAEKKVHKEKIEQIITIQNQLFPNNSLQERNRNFSEFYSKKFIEEIILKINPLKTNFEIVTII